MRLVGNTCHLSSSTGAAKRSADSLGRMLGLKDVDWQSYLIDTGQPPVLTSLKSKRPVALVIRQRPPRVMAQNLGLPSKEKDSDDEYRTKQGNPGVHEPRLLPKEK
jgi:hypothetical protein